MWRRLISMRQTKQEVWPLGSVDTVGFRPPLMTQLHHFVSRIKNEAEMRRTNDVSLWPWPLTLEVTAIVSHMRLGTLSVCQSTKCKLWWYYDYSFSIYEPLSQQGSDWSRDLATLIFDLAGHGACGWCGLRVVTLKSCLDVANWVVSLFWISLSLRPKTETKRFKFGLSP